MTTQKLENVKAECINNEFMEELFVVGNVYVVDFKLDNGQYGIVNENSDITCVSGNKFEFVY